MVVDITGFELIFKVYAGASIKLIFQGPAVDGKKILWLEDVAGFIEKPLKSELRQLRIEEKGGSFNLDLSMRLGRPEIVNYREVFLFMDEKGVDYYFRAAARQVSFGDVKEKNGGWY